MKRRSPLSNDIRARIIEAYNSKKKLQKIVGEKLRTRRVNPQAKYANSDSRNIDETLNSVFGFVNPQQQTF
ncbi:hypothetical protein HZS_8013 [Henneguya salminicola]|nr:hypothetical protein HZS_8013 [Henneguya salminicola]